MTRRTRHILTAVAGLAILAIAGMIWFRPRCQPETCGYYVGSEIRNLIAWQESHRAEHGVYATSYAELGVEPPAPPVRIEFAHADTAGWVARGTHDELEGMSCVAWMGTVPSVPVTDQFGDVAREPGRSYCDFST